MMTQKRRGSGSANRKGVILSVAKNPGLDYPNTQILRLRLRMTLVILSVAKDPGLDYSNTQILRLRLRMTASA